ncbi:hypothetical protein ACJX0J_024283 [Zea mays]
MQKELTICNSLFTTTKIVFHAYWLIYLHYGFLHAATSVNVIIPYNSKHRVAYCVYSFGSTCLTTFDLVIFNYPHRAKTIIMIDTVVLHVIAHNIVEQINIMFKISSI